MGLWAGGGLLLDLSLARNSSPESLVFPLLMVAVYFLVSELAVRRQDVNFQRPRCSVVMS